MKDAIVIGGGHNGLTAAAYLAKAGRDVVVLERRDEIGGLAGTYELAPGFRASIGPELAGNLSTSVIEELELKRHGLELVPLDPVAASAEGLRLWRDVGQSVTEISKYSSRDADAYPRFMALVDELVDFLKPLLTKAPPTPDIQGGADLLALLRLGWDFRQLGKRSMHELLRILPMSVSDFLDEWFESDVLKGLLAAPALEGVCLGPKSAGTAALFLYRRLGNDPALARDLPGALSKAVTTNGGEIRAAAGVSEIRIEDGRVRGVVLENGDAIESTVVLSSVSPRHTFLELLDPSHLEPGFVSEVSRIRYRGVTAKLDLVLTDASELEGVHYVAPSLDYLEKAYDAIKYGNTSERPYLRAVRSSENVLSVLVQYVPCGEAISPDAVIETLGLAGSVQHQHVRTPTDFETELGLPEGNLHHGEMALDQMFFMRPVPGWARYETPVENLYFGGAGAHPGGGISGVPGANAAQVVLRST